MLKGLLKDTLLYGGVDFFFKFVNFCLFPLYAFLLPISEFGILALVTTLTQLLCILMNGGQTYALQRFCVDAKENAKWTGLTSFTCLGFGITLLALLISISFIKDSIVLSWVILGIITACPYQIYQYALTLARIEFDQKRFVLLSAFQNGSLVILSFFLAYYCQWKLTGFLSAAAISGLACGCYCISHIYRHMVGHFDINLAKKMLKFGIPFAFTDITNWLYASLDRWMLEELNGPIEVGYYSMAFKLCTLIIFCINAFGLAWSPHMMKLYGEGKDYRSLVAESLVRWCFFLVVLASFLILFSREILIYTTPEAYWFSADLVPWVSMGLAFHGTLVISTTGLFIEKKTAHLALGTWLGICVNVGLNLYWIPQLGAYGAAKACFFTYLVQGLYTFYYSQKFHPISIAYSKLVFAGLLLFGTYLFTGFLGDLSLPVQFLLKVGCLALIICSGFLIEMANDGRSSKFSLT